MTLRFTHTTRALLLAAIVLLSIAAIVYAHEKGGSVSSGGGGTLYHVVLTQNGFEPSTLSIRAGDSVEFSTTLSEAFWPASDPHPTHGILPSFDPKRPIPADSSWTYTFTKAGVWHYHDHLSVTERGAVTVTGGAGPSPLPKGCDGQCFDDLIAKTVQTKGIDAAYALFQKAYDAGTLPRSCHWTAHRIGEAAYQLFKEGKDVPITEATTYCGYGFFHGFMQSLLRENPDVTYALSFCDKVEKQLGLLGLQNCYHGIGHGFTEDPPDPQTEGDFSAMIAPGTKVCEYLFGGNFTNLNLCLTGVFTVPAGFAADGEYGLSIDPKNPFAYCKPLPYRYDKACYGEFAPKLDVILKWDLTKLPAYLSRIADQKTRTLVAWVVPAVMVAHDIQSGNLDSYLSACHTFGNLDLICVGGIMVGVFSHGEPGKQYAIGLSVCASAILTEAERDICYGQLFLNMHRTYDAKTVESICASDVPAPRRAACRSSDQRSVYHDPSFE